MAPRRTWGHRACARRATTNQRPLKPQPQHCVWHAVARGAPPMAVHSALWAVCHAVLAACISQLRVHADVAMVYTIQRHGAREILPKTAQLEESPALGGPSLLPQGERACYDAGVLVLRLPAVCVCVHVCACTRCMNTVRAARACRPCVPGALPPAQLQRHELVPHAPGQPQLRRGVREQRAGRRGPRVGGAAAAACVPCMRSCIPAPVQHQHGPRTTHAAILSRSHARP